MPREEDLSGAVATFVGGVVELKEAAVEIFPVVFAPLEQAFDDLDMCFCETVSLWVIGAGGDYVDASFCQECVVVSGCQLGAVVLDDETGVTKKIEVERHCSDVDIEGSFCTKGKPLNWSTSTRWL